MKDKIIKIGLNNPFATFLICFFSSQLAGLAILAIPNSNRWAIMGTQSVIQIVFFLLIGKYFYSFLNPSESKLKDILHFKLKNLPRLFAAFVAIQLISSSFRYFIDSLISLSPELNKLYMFYQSQIDAMYSNMLLGSGGIDFALAIIVAAIIPAISEELFFRGYLLSSFKRNRNKYALILTSLLFALVHFNIGDFATLFVFALLLAKYVGIYKGLSFSISLHLLNNAFAMLTLYKYIPEMPEFNGIFYPVAFLAIAAPLIFFSLKLKKIKKSL